jgi:hypothetical protein
MGFSSLIIKCAALVGFDAGMEQKHKDSSAMNTWFNPTAILRYTPTAKTAIAIKAEYYDDRHGVRVMTGTPHGFKTWSFSTNFDYYISPNILWRVEARTLTSTDNIFVGSDHAADNTNTFITTALALSF